MVYYKVIISIKFFLKKINYYKKQSSIMSRTSKLIFKPLLIPEPVIPKYIENYNLPRSEDKLLI